jgi:hypothetical protein
MDTELLICMDRVGRHTSRCGVCHAEIWTGRHR